MGDEKRLEAMMRVIIHDQGGGGSNCTNCKIDTDRNPTVFRVNPQNNQREEYCSNCGAYITKHDTYINQGGSDF